MGLETRELNGAQIAFRVDGAGPPVVFIHGFTLDHRMWQPQIATFAARYRVLTLDMRGFGASSPPVEGVPYSLHEDVAALMEYLGIGPATVVGLSYGGLVAIELTLTRPELVTHLVLVDSTIRHFPYGARWQGVLDDLYRLGKDGKMNEGKELWLADIAFRCPNRSPENSALLRQMVHDYPGWHLTHTDCYAAIEPPAMDRLQEIAVPVLALTGEHDIKEFQDVADFIVPRVQNGRREFLAGAAHMANMDCPEAFNRLVLDFIASV
jgi:3-oxoadipate enol-lactonase